MVLQITGAVSLLALVAVVMPRSWMAATHRWLGLGELPQGAVVDYLSRSTSALYAMFGGMLIVLASDVERHARVVRYWALALIPLGVVMLAVDMAAGMPPYWTAMEGPWMVVFGAILLVLSLKARTPCGQRRTR
jgi:hypothetical protein